VLFYKLLLEVFYKNHIFFEKWLIFVCCFVITFHISNKFYIFTLHATYDVQGQVNEIRVCSLCNMRDEL
jgi:hypothetical protein